MTHTRGAGRGRGGHSHHLSPRVRKPQILAANTSRSVGVYCQELFRVSKCLPTALERHRILIGDKTTDRETHMISTRKHTPDMTVYYGMQNRSRPAPPPSSPPTSMSPPQAHSRHRPSSKGTCSPPTSPPGHSFFSRPFFLFSEVWEQELYRELTHRAEGGVAEPRVDALLMKFVHAWQHSHLMCVRACVCVRARSCVRSHVCRRL